MNKRTLNSLFQGFIGLVAFLVMAPCSFAQSKDWQPTQNHLMTKWAANVNPNNAHPEYPRPQMKRDHWKNLNGLWDFKMSNKIGSGGKYNQQILVPFPVESALSGIGKAVGAAHRVWYRRTFAVDNPYKNGRVLLHFGASDWETSVMINKHFVGTHQGGYDPFTFDITDQMSDDNQQQIEVTVWDPTDLGKQPVGKQTHDPRSIWYSAVSGIWQTVWIEYVPATYIKDLKITPKVDDKEVAIKVSAKNADDDQRVRITAMDNGKKVGKTEGLVKQDLFINLKNPELWSPDHPFLYDLKVELLGDDDQPVDEVSSYFAMRKISLGKGEDGFTRLFLNNKPLFEYGPLDQGWWPDGLYTAPTDEAMKNDIQVFKDMGFNMLRKHVKVEPQRFYYWADKLGILIWQDMPSSDIRPGQIAERTKDSADEYRKEYKRMIDNLYNHPSIVMWVPFNESWGQFQTEKIVRWTQQYDPTRLVDNASGWFDHHVGDVVDMHKYPGPDMPAPEDNRAAVLGEFGGQALVVKGHLWITDFSRAPNHYKTSQSENKLHTTYDQMVQQLMMLKKKGLAAAIYTQATDVESEVNGLMTYDRAVIKFDENHLKKIHQQLIKE